MISQNNDWKHILAPCVTNFGRFAFWPAWKITRFQCQIQMEIKKWDQDCFHLFLVSNHHVGVDRIFKNLMMSLHRLSLVEVTFWCVVHIISEMLQTNLNFLQLAFCVLIDGFLVSSFIVCFLYMNLHLLALGILLFLLGCQNCTLLLKYNATFMFIIVTIWDCFWVWLLISLFLSPF